MMRFLGVVSSVSALISGEIPKVSHVTIAVFLAFTAFQSIFDFNI